MDYFDYILYAKDSYQHGNYDEALNYYKMAMSCISMEDTDKDKVFSLYINITKTFIALNNLNKALSFAEKTVNLMFSEENSVEKFKAINNLAYIHMKMQNYDKAQQKFELLLNWIKTDCFIDYNLITILYNNLGELYYRKKNMNLSIWYYSKALVCFDLLLYKDTRILYSIYSNIKKVYKTYGNNSEYKVWVNKCESLKLFDDNKISDVSKHITTATLGNNNTMHKKKLLWETEIQPNDIKLKKTKSLNNDIINYLIQYYKLEKKDNMYEDDYITKKLIEYEKALIWDSELNKDLLDVYFVFFSHFETQIIVAMPERKRIEIMPKYIKSLLKKIYDY